MALKRYLTCSRALAALPHLGTFLGAEIIKTGPFASSREADAVLAWGYKPSAEKAQSLALRCGLPVLRLEDGFLRSVIPVEDSPCGLVVDDQGMYYNALQASRLEQLVLTDLDADQVHRAQALQHMWCSTRVSKYNHVRGREMAPEEPYVLVVDQTWGDASVSCGLADDNSFNAMLQAALEVYPGYKVLVKTHPDVVAGRKRGYLAGSVDLNDERISVIAEDVHAPDLIERAEAVFCVTSQMGFEALLWGKMVHTFGMPFYAGWGLTSDALAAPERRQPVSLEQLVFAALVSYSRYVHPETRAVSEVESIIEWLGLQRQLRERLPEMLFIDRWPRWKRRALRSFTASFERL